MKKFLSFLTLILATNFLFAQKEVKFDLNKKTGEYTDASGVLFLLEKTKSTSYPGSSNIYINNKEGKHLLFFVLKVVLRDRYINQNNPTGRKPYYEVNIVGLDDQKCEIRYYESEKNLGELIYEKKLIANGELNAEAIKSFIMESGNNISEY